jgi:FtsP/CotA-like multicopper oxidase with cupredoxin domain
MSTPNPIHGLTRRQLVVGGLGLGASALLGGCTTGGPPAGPVPVPAPPTLGTPAVRATLRPGVATVDLGGVTARTWCYDGRVPGAQLRAKAGDVVQVRVRNTLPAETSVHWHGIRLHNAADGVPGITQDPIAAGADYTYTFTAPDPGTYFFHPHSGVQIDRGLYAPLIVDDPAEPGGYDAEWVLVLDDWTDGVGRSPDELLAAFKAEGGTVTRGMNHDMGGMGRSPLGDVGDINYPHYLINGRVPDAPLSLVAKPGQRARIRIINAAADTLFRVALGGHSLTVTHTDGYPVQPANARAVYVAQGERVDLLVTLADGVFPLVASAEGKQGQGLILVRTGAGAAPSADVWPSELDADPLLLTDLLPAEAARLPQREPDQVEQVTLNGQMNPFAWGMNGTTFGSDTPIRTSAGARVRLQMTNETMMAHPMHLHGHTWALPERGGLRKDTVLVLPMQTLVADLQADNPGRWAYHCHNIYHAEVGMMTTLQY